MAHARSIEVREIVSPLDIHQRCDAHVSARCFDPSFATSHVIFRACSEVELDLPQRRNRQVAATAKIAPGLDAWYDGLNRLNLFAAGILGIAVLETLVNARTIHHALHPEYLYVLSESVSRREPVCYLSVLGLKEAHVRVKNMMEITDSKNGYPRMSSVSDSQMLITAA